MDNHETMFEIETLQDWQLNANFEVIEPVDDTGGGASNSNSCCNNSADQP